MIKPPILPEPEVWMRKGTRRAFEHAVKQEFAGATDDELRRLAAVAMGKVSGDLIRVMLNRSLAGLAWAVYCEALALRFGPPSGEKL